MMLIVGLGNPGQQYANNRHNIGYRAVDEIAHQHGFSAERARFQGLTMEGRLDSEKALILKPTTYMNESGRSVAEAMRFYKIDSDDVVVFYDELDLAPGKVRVKKGGGLAGHNGLRSLKAHIGADFRRVRLGIGHPGHKDAVSGYVLRDFPKADHTWLDPLIDAIGQAAPLLASGDDASFMNKVFLITNPDADRNNKKDAQNKKNEQE